MGTVYTTHGLLRTQEDPSPKSDSGPSLGQQIHADHPSSRIVAACIPAPIEADADDTGPRNYRPRFVLRHVTGSRRSAWPRIDGSRQMPSLKNAKETSH